MGRSMRGALGHVLVFRLDAGVFPAPVELQDRGDANLGDPLLGCSVVLAFRGLLIFAGPQLAPDLNVVALLEGDGEIRKPAKHNGAVPFRARVPLATFTAFPRVLRRQRENREDRVALCGPWLGITADEARSGHVVEVHFVSPLAAALGRGTRTQAELRPISK